MNFVYIDESGETGQRSSYIVFASLATDNPRQIEKMTKKIWRAKPQLHPLGELHAHDVDDAIRTRVLRSLAALEVAIDHHKVDKSHQTEPLDVVYYKELAQFIEKHKDAQVIVIDKKDTNKKRQSLLKRLNLTDIFSKVQFESSNAVKPLQVVDFVAWSIGRHYEVGDSTFYDMIRGLERE